MSPTRRELPASLAEVFSVSEALSLGVSRRQLERRGLVRTFHGLRARDEHGQISGPAAYAPRLREGECYSHTTALLLLGCPIVAAEQIHVCVCGPFDRARTRGIVGHRTITPFVRHIAPGGLPVVPPLLALQQSAGILPLIESVVALDHLVLAGTSRRPQLDMQDAVVAIAQLQGRGSQQLRRALRFTRMGAESRMETLTRLLLAAYGLDRNFVLQQEIFDRIGFIGRFDFVDEGRRMIIEYDGEQHRLDRRQYLKDEVRLERVRAAGYRVIRLHREDVLRHPHRTAARIAEIMGTPLRLVRGGEALVVG